MYQNNDKSQTLNKESMKQIFTFASSFWYFVCFSLNWLFLKPLGKSCGGIPKSPPQKGKIPHFLGNILPASPRVSLKGGCGKMSLSEFPCPGNMGSVWDALPSRGNMFLKKQWVPHLPLAMSRRSYLCITKHATFPMKSVTPCRQRSQKGPTFWAATKNLSFRGWCQQSNLHGSSTNLSGQKLLNQQEGSSVHTEPPNQKQISLHNHR